MDKKQIYDDKQHGILSDNIYIYKHFNKLFLTFINLELVVAYNI